jgi:hypothetical protein
LGVIVPPAQKVVFEKYDAGDAKDIQNLDEGTNKDVMAAGGAVPAPDDNGHRSRPFGSNSTSRSGAGAGLNTLRDGIRDGVQEFRQGVRDVVKSVTGRGDDHEDTSAGSAAESP